MTDCKDRVHLILRGHVDTMDRESIRRRRRYSAEFKAELVARCRQPGASVASIALANGMNANVLHRWLAERRQPQAAITDSKSRRSLSDKRDESTFVPVVIEAAAPPPTDIRIELRRAKTAVTLLWPVAAASDCAAWMRELLK